MGRAPYTYDSAALQIKKSRLADIASALAAVDSHGLGLGPPEIEVTGCSVDSVGELFQPQAFVTWKLPRDARWNGDNSVPAATLRYYNNLLSRMKDSGGDLSGSDSAPSTNLEKSVAGQAARVGLRVLGDSLVADTPSPPDEGPCRRPARAPAG